jgi:DHA2 family multidrug resistance protein
LVSHLTPTSIPFQNALHSLTQRFMTHGIAPNEASQRALQTIGLQVQKQSAMLAYLDTFIVLVIACLVAAALTSLLKTIDLKKAQAAA